MIVFAKKYWSFALLSLFIWCLIDIKHYQVKTKQGFNLILNEPRPMYWIHCLTSDVEEIEDTGNFMRDDAAALLNDLR